MFCFACDEKNYARRDGLLVKVISPSYLLDHIMAAAEPEKNASIEWVTSAMLDVETGGRSERFPLLGDPSTRGQPQQHQRQQQQQRQREQNLPRTFTEPDAVQVLEKLPLLLVRAVAVFTMATTSSCVLAAVSAPGDPRVEHLYTCDSAPRNHGGPLPLAPPRASCLAYLGRIDKPVLQQFLHTTSSSSTAPTQYDVSTHSGG